MIQAPVGIHSMFHIQSQTQTQTVKNKQINNMLLLICYLVPKKMHLLLLFAGNISNRTKKYDIYQPTYNQPLRIPSLQSRHTYFILSSPRRPALPAIRTTFATIRPTGMYRLVVFDVFSPLRFRQFVNAPKIATDYIMLGGIAKASFTTLEICVCSALLCSLTLTLSLSLRSRCFFVLC